MLVRDAGAFGDLIADRRRELGLSQSALAARIGASRYWVSEVEHGKDSAEVGLVLSALHALGFAIDIALAEGGPDPEGHSEPAVRRSLTRGGKPLRSRRPRKSRARDGS